MGVFNQSTLEKKKYFLGSNSLGYYRNEFYNTVDTTIYRHDEYNSRKEEYCAIQLRGSFQSSYLYSKEETATFKKTFKLDGFFWMIDDGLHARVSTKLRGSINTIWIIPKGTKYYLGTQNDIVAEKMIFESFYGPMKTKTEKMEKLIKWRDE